jgi:hypothetical protein
MNFRFIPDFVWLDSSVLFLPLNRGNIFYLPIQLLKDILVAFQFLVIMVKVPINIYIQVFSWMKVFKFIVCDFWITQQDYV